MIQSRCAACAGLVAAIALAAAGAGCRTATHEMTRRPTSVVEPATALEPDATSASVTSAATARPTRTPTPTGEPRLKAPRTEFEGVSISVPAELASNVVASFVPATPEGDHPVAGRVRFELEGYPVTGRTEPARVEVFQGPMSDGAPPHLIDRYRPLFMLLEEQPKEPTYVDLMPENKRELFLARLSYRPYYDMPGRGARFLTQFGNTPRPINNGELMYVFQGLSPVQAAWVAITAPITVNDPAVAAGPDSATPEGFAAGFTLYMTRTVPRLNALPPDAFTPNLKLLDELAASVDVTWPGPTEFAPPPGTPPSAAPTPVVTARPRPSP